MLLCALALAGSHVFGAEVRGNVAMGTGQSGPVSVALLPLDGQPLPARAPREHVVHIRDHQFDPPYLIARVGDRLRLVNDDGVYHVLIAPYGAQSVNVTLGKAGTASTETAMTLRPRESLYIFCRIHQRTYLRVDVVETSLARMLDAERRFEFRDLSAGRWRLRVATRSGDPAYKIINAFTAPPPVTVTLPDLPAAAAATSHLHVDRVEALFPSVPVQP